jgi:WD40 repeat protein
MWDVAKNAMVFELPRTPDDYIGRTRPVSYAFSPDGKELAVGDYDKQTLRFLDVARGRELRTFDKTFASNLTFSESGNALAVFNRSSIALLDSNIGNLLQAFQGYTRSASAMAVSKDGHYLAVESEDLNTQLWDLNLGRRECG